MATNNKKSSQPTRIPKPTMAAVSRDATIVPLQALAHQAHWDTTFNWLLDEIQRRAGDEEFEVSQSVWLRPDLNLYELTDFIMQETDQVIVGSCSQFPAPLSDFLDRYHLRATWKWTSLSIWSIVFSWRHLRVKNATDVIEDTTFSARLNAAMTRRHSSKLNSSQESWKHMLDWMERRILELAQEGKTQLIIPDVTWNRSDLNLPEVASAVLRQVQVEQLEGQVEVLGIPEMQQFVTTHPPVKLFYSAFLVAQDSAATWYIRAEWPLVSTSLEEVGIDNPSTPSASA